ncbi:MAG: NlpC/P60 family protein [Suipraeoptans sp.]
MKKTIRVVLTSVLISSLVVTPVFATPSSAELEEQQKVIEQQKSAKDAEVAEYQSQYTSLINKIDELEADIIETGEKVTQAQEELEAAEERSEKQNEDMKLRIKFMYESGGSSNAMEMYMESNSFSELVTQAEYVQNINKYDRDKLEEYIATLNEVKELKAELDTQMAALEAQQAEFESKKNEVSVLLETAQSEQSNLGAALQEAIAAAEAARQEEARIAAEAARQAAAAAAAAASNNYSTASAGSTGSSTSSSSGGSSSVSTPSYQGQGNTAVAQAIVAAAYSQLGVPYVWGGTSAGSGLDCSGLTQYAHRVAGISIPRTSGSQYAGGQVVSNPQPGDICWTPGHVAIYIGGGQMIEAPQPGDVVKISSVRASAYVRYW